MTENIESKLIFPDADENRIKWYDARNAQGYAEGLEICGFLDAIKQSGVEFTSAELKDMIIMKLDSDRQIQLMSMQSETSCNCPECSGEEDDDEL